MNNSSPPPIPQDPFRFSNSAGPQWFPMFLVMGMIGVERCVYYGIRALILLFLVDNLAIDYEMGYLKYSLAAVLGYVSLIPGGIIGDFLVRRKWALPLSFLFEGAGAIFIATGSGYAVWLGWALLIMGSGLMRPSSWAYLGELMPGDRSRRMGAFFLAFVGVNLFAMLAPLVGNLFENHAFAIRFFGFLALVMAMVSGVMAFTNVLPTTNEESQAHSLPKALLGALGILLMSLIGFLVMSTEAPFGNLLKNLGGLLTLIFSGLAFLLIALQKGRKIGQNLGLALLFGISILFWFGYEISSSSRFPMIYESLPKFLTVDMFMILNPVISVLLGTLACLLLFFALAGKGKVKSLAATILLGTLVAFIGTCIMAFSINQGTGFGLILLMMVFEVIAEILVTPLVFGLSWEFGSAKWRATGMGLIMGAYGIVTLFTGWVMSMNEIGLVDTSNPVVQSVLAITFSFLTIVVSVVFYFTRKK